MKNIILILALIIITFQLRASNLGHRAGGDVYKHLPENSLEVLELSIAGSDEYPPLQNDPAFEYLEFDVWETKDHELVVFHDITVKRLLPYKGANKDIYKKMWRKGEVRRPTKLLSIKHLTLKQIKRLYLLGDVRFKVPTLKEYLDKIRTLNLIKPILMEIKYIRTDEGRKKLIDMYSKFKMEYMENRDIEYVEEFDFPIDPAQMMSFKAFFRLSFGITKKKRRKWCDYFRDSGFSTFGTCGRHHIDQCKGLTNMSFEEE